MDIYLSIRYIRKKKQKKEKTLNSVDTYYFPIKTLFIRMEYGETKF